MKDCMHYLRQNVVAEPLVRQWYAWPYLISPATNAMSIANLHVPLMKSFVSAPQLHSDAVNKRRLLGGRFIGYDKSRVEHVKSLLDETVVQNMNLINLADDIRTLEGTVRTEAVGFSMEKLYEKVPDGLKGYVELVYDLNNNPSIRFIEPLLYKSQYYDVSSQSLLLSKISNDERPFSLGTPRLINDEQLHLKMPFNSAALDELFSMKTVPQTFDRVMDMLKLSSEQADSVLPYLTKSAPRCTKRYEGRGVRLRYFGHACVLIETSEVSVMIDPVISYSYPNGISRYTYEDLPEVIDYVLITHNHQDHCMLETLLQLRHKVQNIVVPRNGGGFLQDPSLRLMFQNIGFSNVIEMSELDEIPVPGGVIVGIPFLGEHSDLDIQSRVAYLIKLHGTSMLFAADSRNLESRLYEHLHRIYGEIDMLFLGMECSGAPLSWLYGPLMTKTIERQMDQSRRLNGSDYARAIDIVERIKAKTVYVYALGQEPWLNYVMSIYYDANSPPIVESNKLIEDCERRGLNAERLFAQKEIHLMQ